MTVTHNAAGPGAYGVPVSGVTFTAQRALDNTVVATTSQVEVLVQRRTPGLDDEALAWSDLPLTTHLPAGAPDAQGIVVRNG